MRPLPIPELTEAQKQVFWSQVQRGGPEECWLWTGRKQSPNAWGGGVYGIFCLTINGREYTFKPHRVSYTLEMGSIPEGLTLDHVQDRGCTSTLCCNPAHLEAVTQSENSYRHHIKRCADGFCKWGHPREPHKRCKGCAIRNLKLYQQRHPEKWAEIKRNQKRKERARAKELVSA